MQTHSEGGSCYYTNTRRTWRVEQIRIEAHALENRTRLQALAPIGLQQSPDLLRRHVIIVELREVCFSLKAVGVEHGCVSPEPGAQALEEGLHPCVEWHGAHTQDRREDGDAKILSRDMAPSRAQKLLGPVSRNWSLLRNLAFYLVQPHLHFTDIWPAKATPWRSWPPRT